MAAATGDKHSLRRAFVFLMARAFAFALVFFVSVVPKVPGTASQLAPPQQSQEHPVFRAALDRVRVDVIVTDEQGRFVDDLQAGDFVAYEDGVRQRIRSLQLVELPEGRVVEMGTSGSGSDGADSTGVATHTIRRTDFGAVVYLVDFPGLDHRTKLNFVEAWGKVLARTDSTLELLSEFAQALSARRGRTARVWVSMGVTLNPLRAGNGFRAMPGYCPNRGILGPAARNAPSREQLEREHLRPRSEPVGRIRREGRKRRQVGATER